MRCDNKRMREQCSKKDSCKAETKFSGSNRKIQKRMEEDRSKSLIVAIHDTKYSLVHLLEKGHQKRGGGRVAAIKHVEPAEQAAIAELEKEIASKL